MQIAGPSLDNSVAERIVTEIKVGGLSLSEYVSHVEKSIGTSRNDLHPALIAVWAIA